MLNYCYIKLVGLVDFMACKWLNDKVSGCLDGWNVSQYVGTMLT